MRNLRDKIANSMRSMRERWMGKGRFELRLYFHKLNVPKFQFSASNFQLRAPNFQLRAPNFQLRAPNFQLRAPNSEIGTFN